MSPQLTDQDYELLSAYLDDMLSAAERAALEARLASDDALRRELAALRQTVALVQNLPLLAAPRSFALTPAMLNAPERVAAAPPVVPAPAPVRVLPRRAPPPWVPLTAAAAAVLVFMVGFYAVVYTGSNTAPAGSMQVASAPTATPLPFQNMVVDESAPANPAAAAVLTEAPKEPAATQPAADLPLTFTPDAPDDAVQAFATTGQPQQFSQGGMGGGGGAMGMGGAPEIDLTLAGGINPDVTLRGFTAATLAPAAPAEGMTLLAQPSSTPQAEGIMVAALPTEAQVLRQAAPEAVLPGWVRAFLQWLNQLYNALPR